MRRLTALEKVAAFVLPPRSASAHPFLRRFERRVRLRAEPKENLTTVSAQRASHAHVILWVGSYGLGHHGAGQRVDNRRANTGA
jgi:hypothetical protein